MYRIILDNYIKFANYMNTLSIRSVLKMTMQYIQIMTDKVMIYTYNSSFTCAVNASYCVYLTPIIN